MHRLLSQDIHVEPPEGIDIDLDIDLGHDSRSRLRKQGRVRPMGADTDHEICSILLRPDHRDRVLAQRALWSFLDEDPDANADPIVLDECASVTIPWHMNTQDPQGRHSEDLMPLATRDSCPLSTNGRSRRRNAGLSFSYCMERKSGVTAAQHKRVPRGSDAACAPDRRDDDISNREENAHEGGHNLASDSNRSREREPSASKLRPSSSMSRRGSTTMRSSLSERNSRVGVTAAAAATPTTTITTACSSSQSREPSEYHRSQPTRPQSAHANNRTHIKDHQDGARKTSPDIQAITVSPPLFVRELPPDSRLTRLTTSQKARTKEIIERRMSLEFGIVLPSNSTATVSSTPTSVSRITTNVSSTATSSPAQVTLATSATLPVVSREPSYMRPTASRRASMSTDAIPFNGNPIETSGCSSTVNGVKRNVGFTLRGRPVPPLDVLAKQVRFENSTNQ